MTIARTLFRRLRIRWKRTVVYGLAGLTTAYAGVFAAVALAVSPSDRFVMLPDGRLLAYSVQGSESASTRVILVHGAPADASSWRRFLDAHADSFADVEFVTIDRLGYGRSDRSVETSLEAHARSLAPLLTERTILVGHSYGGPVALTAAALHPDRVAGLVLVAGATDPNMNDAQGFRRFLEAMAPVIPQAWSSANLELLALTDENAAVAPLLADVTCPVVVVHGAWDPVCPHDGTTSHLQSALSRAQTVTVDSVPHAGHNLHLHHHGRIAGAIESMLAPSSTR